MAAETPLGKLSQIVLRDMNIVAGEAGHIRGAEATALLQHAHLITMKIRWGVGIGRRKTNELIQRITGTVGKRRQERLARSGMTPSTKIHLAVSRESRRIQYGGR